MTTLWRHWQPLIFSELELYLICHTISSFYKRSLLEKDERPPNMFVIFALLITDVNFAYWPLLQMLLSTNVH